MENCNLYTDLLVQQALGEITDKERLFLKAHLDACPTCRGQLAALSDTVGVLKREKHEAAPSGLAERTLKRVESAGKRLTVATSPYHETSLFQPGTWQVRRSLVGWMVAASVLVMAVASLVPEIGSSDGNRQVLACQDHMRIVATALRQYAHDHNGFYPQGQKWHEALDAEYLMQSGALLCPGRVAVGAPSELEVDYIYNPSRTSTNVTEDYPLMWDRKGAHDRLGRNVLFATGHISWVEEDEFEQITARYRIDEAAAARMGQ